jgi:nucleoid-associated protein YgaU
MNLPILIKKIYNEVSLTGLYSFEFVDDKRKTITEIFFMQPPKQKSLEEVTRSSVVPTLTSNFVLDAGNGTKRLNISGNLWFVTVGSPDNPVASEPGDLPNQIDGLNEFFKLRWMLIRYKDYTMTRKGRMTIPTSPMAFSPQLNALYSKIKDGDALADKVSLVFHDYDMDDHYYVKISSFMASQSSDDYLSVDYSISGECYERYNISSQAQAKIKKTEKEEVEAISKRLAEVNFSEKLAAVESQLGYNNPVFEPSLNLGDDIESIIAENTNIQTGKSTIFDSMLELIDIAKQHIEDIQVNFLDIYVIDKDAFSAGMTTLESYVDVDMLAFYNDTQKIKMIIEGMAGIIGATPKQDDIVFYENADTYTLTEEQFTAEELLKIQSTSTFVYHVLKQGETFRSLAVRYYGEAEKATAILQANNISQNELIDENYVGSVLKIPIQTDGIARSAKNIVYDGELSPENLENFLHGRDIMLQDGKLLPSAMGDMRTVEGSENTLQALDRRMDTAKGALNIYNTDFGLLSIDDGNLPFLVKLSRYLDDMVFQFQADPRVASVQMLLDTLELKGEKISIKNKISLIGAEDAREVSVG